MGDAGAMFLKNLSGVGMGQHGEGALRPTNRSIKKTVSCAVNQPPLTKRQRPQSLSISSSELSFTWDVVFTVVVGGNVDLSFA